MYALARAIAGIVVAIEIVFCSVVNNAAKISPSEKLSRALWTAGLWADHPDLANPHTDEWLKHIMINASSLGLRNSAGWTWLQVADPDSEGDLDYAYALIDSPRGSKSQQARDFGVRLLIKRLKEGKADERIFGTAVRLSDGDKGSVNQSARLLGYFGDSKHRAQAEGILEKILRDRSNREAQPEAQESMLRMTGHRPHFDGEMFCEKHPLIINGVPSKLR